MRLDVYQHVAKDADNIEDMISGAPNKTASSSHQSFLGSLITEAYAQEDSYGPAAQAAISRRKDRRPQLQALEAKGLIGENALGLVEVRTGSSGQDLVQAENNDRMIIYQAIADKNGTSISQVEQVYSQKVQEHAPAGTPIENSPGWSIKQ